MFFFFMLLDSHIENKISTPTTLGIPRWHKRILYYLFKIRYLQYCSKKLSRVPNYSVRFFLTKPYFNEFELVSKI
jgi:hypothetical protein